MARFQAQTNAVLNQELEEIRGLRDPDSPAITRLELSDEETRRLADVLNRGFNPPPALLESLKRLADSSRTPPELTWSDHPA